MQVSHQYHHVFAYQIRIYHRLMNYHKIQHTTAKVIYFNWVILLAILFPDFVDKHAEAIIEFPWLQGYDTFLATYCTGKIMKKQGVNHKINRSYYVLCYYIYNEFLLL